MEIKTPAPVDVLSLGSGWTGTFLKEELKSRDLSFASTSRDGSDDTIPFTFNPGSSDPKQYATLPLAKTVVIIFPVVVSGAHGKLIDLYERTHPEANNHTQWIQLGSTSAFDFNSTDVFSSFKRDKIPLWRDRHTKVDTSKPRVQTEEELLVLPDALTAVLNLAGLWGGSRDMRNYVDRVAPTKAALKGKGSLHLIHGIDVARSLAAMHDKFVAGRWLLTDLRVYDWWELASAWGARGEGTATMEYAKWVTELMGENGIRALPRSAEQMGVRALDSREFWETYKELKGPLRAGLTMQNIS